MAWDAPLCSLTFGNFKCNRLVWSGLAWLGLVWPGDSCFPAAWNIFAGIAKPATGQPPQLRLPPRLRVFSILMELSLDLNKFSCFCFWLYLVTIAVVAVVFWLSFSSAAPSVSQRQREFIDNFEMFGVSFVDFKVITYILAKARSSSEKS